MKKIQKAAVLPGRHTRNTGKSLQGARRIIGAMSDMKLGKTKTIWPASLRVVNKKGSKL